MPVQLESDLEGKLKSWARAHDLLTLKLNLQGNTGWPDRVFLYRGRQVFIELKRPGHDLKRNQPARIEELVSRGFTVGVFDELRSATSLLEATLLSASWRDNVHQAGVCWIALQARPRENIGDLYGVPYFAGQRVC